VKNRPREPAPSARSVAAHTLNLAPLQLGPGLSNKLIATTSSPAMSTTRAAPCATFAS
jgi:hypothetical protein